VPIGALTPLLKRRNFGAVDSDRSGKRQVDVGKADPGRCSARRGCVVLGLEAVSLDLAMQDREELT